jgi:hypothetical protein
MNQNFNHRILGSAAACFVLGLAATPQSPAAVSDEDFSALKSMVQQLQQAHDQDQQQIQQLKQQLGDTQTQVQKTDAAVQAQSTSTVRNALHNFTMVGDAEVQYAKTFGNDTHSGFVLADFAPIFLFQANEKVLFEAGFDITLNNGQANGPLDEGGSPIYTHDSGSSTSVSISFAQLDYIMNDYMTFVGGYMLLPLGTYSERAAGMLNKIPDDPLGREFLPGAGAGAQLRGAFTLGNSGQMLTYSIYGANGPSSVDGSGNAYTLDSGGSPIANLDLGGNVGLLNSGNTGNLHTAPSGGGRIGWFIPWGGAHKDLEIGVSGQTGVWDDAGNHYWNAGVLDASLHIGPNFELKGEFINAWYGTSDIGTIHPWAVWAQAGYKLAGLNLDMPVINDIELMARYDKESDGLGTNIQRYTAGYVYYLTNTLLFEGDYEWLHSNDSSVPANQLILQLSYGF